VADQEAIVTLTFTKPEGPGAAERGRDRHGGDRCLVKNTGLTEATVRKLRRAAI
jgi:hypothetical protein